MIRQKRVRASELLLSVVLSQQCEFDDIAEGSSISMLAGALDRIYRIGDTHKQKLPILAMYITWLSGKTAMTACCAMGRCSCEVYICQQQ